ncbi:MAG: bifunctional 23S rRNA (guanine(2069)-N(7))-methyltransferase RlmK/23S rRNA (guanine(2445)-N(2))-methyltransferase RlmL [Phycisphaeraceae bacterium]|nr:bifunctional 23S rRNA (guanine(2069)-N(7))-methyltransferase RlmK/23S rRNA (guanine(2445)-N(2))-methyltransferase RlmL [Phycisphaeraceae bacterium]
MRTDLLATCTFGLEAVVVRELAAMGYPAKPVGTGRVSFEGDARAIVDTNLHLRTADRVLIRVGDFPVGGGDEGFDALFEGVRGLCWERWIAPTAAFVVSGRCVRSVISSEPAVQRATKRAIVDRLRSAHTVETLPETGPTVRVEVALVNDHATLTIDSSGSGLHKRGYREGTPGEAALRETLAAGLVLLSVWRPGRPLVDPFCGVGTIAIEAAMIARRIAPGLSRSFDAERWLDCGGQPLIDRDLWEDCRSDARAQILPDRVRPTIHAGDIDDRALALARINAQRAGVDRDIHFVRRDALELSSTLDYGVVITNPPYGERLGGDEHEIESLYRALPGVFRRLPTWSFHILTGRLDMEHLFGQQAHRRRKLYNAKIETTYFSFLGPKPPGMERMEREEDAPEFEAGPTGVDGVADVDAVGDVDGEAGAQADSDVGTVAGAAGSDTTPQRGPSRPSIPPAFGGLRERDEREAEEFARCLANNLRHLRKYPSRGITCYRVYERDAPDVPLIIDRYEDHYHAVEYERGGGHSRSAAQQADWADLMRSTIARVAEVPIGHVHLKEKHRQRGLSQHERVSEEGQRTIVREGEGEGGGGLRFEVNLTDYIDTGLFLDHRLTRAMVRKEAQGKRFLNLFCYTGAFSVYAAAGGALHTTSVDLSNTYLDWAHRNFALNGMGGRVCRDREPSAKSPHALIRSGVMEFLTSARNTYDLMIIDPPTFSNSKSTDADWDVQTHHTELLTRAAHLLGPGGVIYFSTNFRRFKLDEEALSALRIDHPPTTPARNGAAHKASSGHGAGGAGSGGSGGSGGEGEHALSIREISRQTVPPEYRNTRIHRCWRMSLVPVATMRPPRSPTPPLSPQSRGTRSEPPTA